MDRESRVDKKIKKKKRITLLMITILILAILFTIILTKTTFFHIKKIEIKGNSVVADENIKLASGINIGENIFKMNIEEVENSLLRHPYIKTIEVKRKYPDTIKLNIKERKETLVYKKENTYVYLDNEGYVLNELSSLKNENIPVLQTDNNIMVKNSKKIDFKKAPYIKESLDMLNICNKNNISFEISKIIHENGNITIVLNSGTNIAIGGFNDIEYKLRLIDEIVNDLQQKEILAKEILLNKGKNPIIVK